MSRYRLLIIAICISLLFGSFVIAPPVPKNVAGNIYDKKGEYTTGSLPVIINNTNTSEITHTMTTGQGPPRLQSSYSAAISAAVDDIITVSSWNSTHYGSTTAFVSTKTTEVDVYLNLTRPSETNVTITTPSNNTLNNISDYFEVEANIMIIGGQDATGCTATISFSNSSVLVLAPDETPTNNLGDIGLGNSVVTSWNLTGNFTGSSDISIYAGCISDGDNFQGLNNATVSNITIQDITSPLINLQYPKNSSIITLSEEPIIFKYNVSDSSTIANCSLLIGNIINQTNLSVSKDITQNFSTLMSNATYNWSVWCYDYLGNLGTSETFNVTFIYNQAPYIFGISMDSSIDLAAGSASIVSCNATVRDQNLFTDIKNITAFLHHISLSYDSPDDNNNHYTNSSCVNSTQGNYEKTYVCSFGLMYYSDSGQWSCNFTATDQGNLTGSSNITSNVNELLAVDVSPGVIDFKELESGENSSMDTLINLTNIGNIGFNVTLDAYSQDDGDGLAMNCTNGAIPLENERYSLVPGFPFSAMSNITDVPVMIPGFSLPQKTNDTTYKSDRNNTYWKLSVPKGIRGRCNGTVTIKAVS